ncbi:MAG: hypothetical protein ACMV0J_04645 [Fluviibacter sp.]
MLISACLLIKAQHAMGDFNLSECRGLDQEHAFLRLLARSEQGTSLILANLLGCHQARLLCKRSIGFLHVVNVGPTGNGNQVINGSLGVKAWGDAKGSDADVKPSPKVVLRTLTFRGKNATLN